MPYRCHVIPEYRLGVVRLSGDVTGAELFAAATALTADALWIAGFDELWDGRTIGSLTMDLSEMQAIENLPRANPDRYGPGQSAVVVTRDLDYSISRLFTHTARIDGRTIRVFRSMDAALAWLGLPASVLPDT